MEIYPISFDSLGTRSMATFVKTNVNIFIDPYAALAPRRYGLFPHETEFNMLNFYLNIIYKLGKFSEYVIITHYHYDHHPRPNDNNFFESFKNSKFLIKDFSKEHRSAKIRGKLFIKNLEKYGIEYEYVDGEEIKIGKTKLIFSEPVWHGEINSKVGRVITLLIKHKKQKMFFGSDAQFLIDEKALSFVLDNRPNFLIIDGFPTILEGYKVSSKSFEVGLKHMKVVIEEINFDKMIVDHHLLRDKEFKKKFPYYSEKIITAAEFYGLQNLQLEAYRKELYNGYKFDLDVYKNQILKVVEKIINGI
ncbi:MAG: MBL fold metallo-hydrolase [Candidatus Aenigmatarchaeota archaeon]